MYWRKRETVNTWLALYSLFLQWHINLPIILGLLASHCVYLLLVQRCWRKTGKVAWGAALTWTLGLLIIFLALESPLDTIAEQSLFSAHMLQHELLMAVAPPLLLLGLFPRLVVPITRPVIKPLFRNRFTYQALRVLFSPYCTLLVWLLVLYVWAVPSLYVHALYVQPLHILEHISLVAAGMLFWLPVIEPVPGLVRMRLMHRLIYLAVAQMLSAPLVAILLWSPSLVYSYYLWRTQLLHISSLLDQQFAALMMMVIDMLVTLTLMTWLILKTLSFAEWQEKRQTHVSLAE